MKQFSIKEYLKNPSCRVVTREGDDARIICIDRKAADGFNVVALIPYGETEHIRYYSKNGRYCNVEETAIDLFFASEKHELWVAAYYVGESTHRCIGTFESEEEFLNYKKMHPEFDFVMEQKMEWEE